MRILFFISFFVLISCNSQETKLSRIQSIHPFLTQLGLFTTFGGTNSGEEECVSMVIDKYENIYCAGYTDGSMTGPFANLANDAIITKFNRHGKLQWVVQLNTATVNSFNGGDAAGVDSCLSLALDRHQNVYCGGSTISNLGGPGSYQGTVLSDAFFVKVSPSGKITMIRQFGAIGVNKTDSCNGIVVDSADKIYCAGITAGDLGEPNAQAAGTGDIYIGKFNNNGSTIWIRQLGSVSKVSVEVNANLGVDACNAIALSPDEKTVYCAGYAGTAVASATKGSKDLVMISMNTSDGLNFKGVQDGSTSIDECFSIAVDNSGNLYCGGSVKGDLFVFNANGTDDFAILKTDSSLNVLERFQYSSVAPANDILRGIKVDIIGKIYLGGSTFGDMGGNTDLFGNGILLKLDPDGNIIWEKVIGDPARPDAIRAIAVDKEFNVYGSGYTQNDLGETNAGGTSDIILFRLDANGND